jgi:hypothetical protein
MSYEISIPTSRARFPMNQNYLKCPSSVRSERKTNVFVSLSKAFKHRLHKEQKPSLRRELKYSFTEERFLN